MTDLGQLLYRITKGELGLQEDSEGRLPYYVYEGELNTLNMVHDVSKHGLACKSINGLQRS